MGFLLQISAAIRRPPFTPRGANREKDSRPALSKRQRVEWGAIRISVRLPRPDSRLLRHQLRDALLERIGELSDGVDIDQLNERVNA
jgi:hypothetical protein